MANIIAKVFAGVTVGGAAAYYITVLFSSIAASFAAIN